MQFERLITATEIDWMLKTPEVSIMQTNQQWQARREAAVTPGVGNALPVYIAKARNAEIWDVEGRRYIDFASGIAVLNTGHNHPDVMRAVQGQLECFTHPCFQVTPYGSYVELAEKLNALAPIAGPAQTLLMTTGAEAVENAIKVARIATGRSGVIAFRGGFHGRTLLGMALTGKVQPYKKGTGHFPVVSSMPLIRSAIPASAKAASGALQGIFAADVSPDDVAAIIIEPVQERAALRRAADLLSQLRQICDEHGIVLIADEIQSGFCRTGKTFAIEHSGVEPDIITMAKAGGGFPLSAVVGRAALMQKAQAGTRRHLRRFAGQYRRGAGGAGDYRTRAA